MHEFKIGAVLGDTFRVFFRNILPFGAMAVIIYGALAIFESALNPKAMTATAEPTMMPSSPGLLILIAILSILFIYFLSAMITYGTYQDLRGSRAGFGACVGRGVTLVLPVVGASILVMVIVMLLSLLLVIPGLIAMFILSVVVPVVVVERPGAFAALGRSRELTKGHRWKIFGIFFVLLVISWVAMVAVILLSMPLGLFASQVLMVLAQSLSAVLMAVAPAVAYYHLRRAKEGVDIEQIAAVFD